MKRIKIFLIIIFVSVAKLSFATNYLNSPDRCLDGYFNMGDLVPTANKTVFKNWERLKCVYDETTSSFIYNGNWQMSGYYGNTTLNLQTSFEDILNAMGTTYRNAFTAGHQYSFTFCYTCTNNVIVDATSYLGKFYNDINPGSTQASATQLCYNDATGTTLSALTGATTGTGTLVYKFWYSTNNGSSYNVAQDYSATTSYIYKNITSSGQGNWYNIKRSVSNSEGTCRAHDNTVISVYIANPTTVGSISGSSSPICYNQNEGTLTANPNGGIGSYNLNWYKNGSSTGISTSTYAAGNLTSSTSYYYTINNCGQSLTSPTVSVTVRGDLTAAGISGGTTPLCYNANEGTLTANPSGGDGSYVVYWYKNGSYTGYSGNTYAAGSLTASASYYYSVASCSQSKTSATYSVTVNPNLTADAITGGTSPLCYSADEGTLTAHPAGGNGSYVITWYKNGASTGLTGTTYAAGQLTANANYYYTVTSCGQSAQSPTYTVSVNGDLTTGAISGYTSPICYNVDEGTLTANPSGGNGSYLITWYKNGSSTGQTGTTYAAGQLTANTNYYYTVTSCGQTKQSPTVNITVNPDLTIGTITGSTSPICYNIDEGTLTANPSGGNGSYVITWYKNGASTGLTGTTYAAGQLTANTNYYYTVTSCGQTKQSPTVNITVNSDLTADGIIGSTNPLCYNANEGTLSVNVSGGNGTYTYVWYKNAVNTGINTSTYSAGQLTANTSYYYKVTSCGQTKTSPTLDITVNPDLSIGGISGTTSPLCYNANEGTLTANPSGGDGNYTVTWYKNGTSTTLNGSTYAAGQLTSNTSYYYTATSCGITKTSSTVNITVQPDLNAGAITGSTSPICYNVDEGTFTANPSGGDGTYIITWYKNGVSTGLTGTTYSAGQLTANTSYYYIVTSCSQSKQSATLNIVVNPDLNPGTILGYTTPLCYGANEGTLTASPSGGNGTYSVTWFKNGTNTVITTPTYSAGNLNINTDYYYTVSSCGQTKQSSTLSIVVNPDLSVGTITGATSPLCYNADEGTLTANPSGGDGTYTVTWYKNGTSTTLNGSTYGAGQLTANTSYYYTATSCGQTKTSSTISITVQPDLIAGPITGSTSPICFSSDEGTLTANPSGGDGNYLVTWYKNGASTGLTGTTYPAGNLTSFTSFNYTVSSCGQTKTSPTITVSVYPVLSSGTIAFTDGTADLTKGVCKGANGIPMTTGYAPSGGVGSWSYKYLISTDGINYSPIAGATTEGYSPQNLRVDTWYERVNTNVCGAVTTDPLKYTIFSIVKPGSIESYHDLCNGTETVTINSTSDASDGSGDLKYTWFSTNNPTLLPGAFGWNQIGGSNVNSINTGTLTSDTYYVRSITDNACGTVLYSDIAYVKVFAPLTAGEIGSDQTTCSNVPVIPFYSVSPASGGSGTRTYSWEKSTALASLPGDPTWTGIINTDSLVHYESTLPISTKFVRKVSERCGIAYSNAVTVTILPEFKPGIIGPSNIDICNGAAAPVITSTANGSGATGTGDYIWMATQNKNYVIGSSDWVNLGTTTTPTFNPGTFTDTSYIVRIYSDPICGTIASNVLTIKVKKPLNPGAVGANQVKCYGSDADPFTSISPASGGTNSFGYSWLWTSNANANPGDANWTVFTSSNSLTFNDGVLYSTRFYTRKAVDACGTTFTPKLTVEIKSDVTPGEITGDQILCNLQGIRPIYSKSLPTGGMGSPTYEWYQSFNPNSIPGDGNWQKMPGESGVSLVVNSISGKTLYTRRVIDVCKSAYSNVVTKDSRPALTAGLIGEDKTVCDSAILTPFVSLNSPAGGYGKYAINWYTTQITTANPGDGNWQKLNNSSTLGYSYGQITKTAKFVREVVDSICTTAQYTNVITINVKALLNGGVATGDNNVCYGADLSTFKNKISPSGGYNSFTYNWLVSSNPNAKPGDVSCSIIPLSNTDTLHFGNIYQNSYFWRSATDVCGTVYSPKITVLVKPALNPGEVIGNQTACYLANPTKIWSKTPASGGFNQPNYHWLYTEDNSSVPGSSIGWTLISGATDSIYFEGPLSKSRYLVRQAVDACGTTYTSKIAINVLSPLKGGIIGDSSVICNLTKPSKFKSKLSPLGGSGKYKINWLKTEQLSLEPDIDNWDEIINSNNTTLDYGVLSQSTQFVRLVTDTVCNTQEFSNHFTIAVKPPVNGGLIGNDVSGLCNGFSVPTLLNKKFPSGGFSLFNYEWMISHYANAIPGDTSWTSIPLSNSDSLRYGNLYQTSYFIRQATETCDTVYSNKVTVIVKNPLSPGELIGNQTICNLTAPSKIWSKKPASGGFNQPSYSWLFTEDNSSTPGSSSGWSVISGASDSVYFEGILSKTRYLVRKAVDACGTTFTSKIALNVRPKLIGGTIGDSTTICNLSRAPQFSSKTSATGGSGNYTITWYKTEQLGTQPDINNWNSISNSNTAVLNYATALSKTTKFARLTIDNVCNSKEFSNAVTIAVKLPVDGGVIGNNISGICNGLNLPTLVNKKSPSGGFSSFSYQWMISHFTNAVPGDTSWSIIALSNLDSLKFGNIYSTSYFIRQTKETCDTVYSNKVTVIVNKPLVGGDLIGTQTICNSTSPKKFYSKLPATGGNDINKIYTWYMTQDYNALPGTTTGWTLIPAANDSALQYGNITKTTYFYRQATDLCGMVYTSKITVSVLPALSAGEIGTNHDVCKNTDGGSIISISAASGGTNNFTYSWEKSINKFAKPNDGNWSSVWGTNQYYQPGTLTETSVYTRKATDFCGSVYTSPVILTVLNPHNPGLISADNPSVCYNTDGGKVSNTLSVTGGSGVYYKQFYYTTDESKSAFDASWIKASSTGDELFNGKLTQTTLYIRETVDSICNYPLYSNITKIHVNQPLTAGKIKGEQTICFNAIAGRLSSYSSASGGSGNYDYTWLKSTDSTAIPGSNQWTEITLSGDTGLNPGSLNKTSVFVRRVNDGVCNYPLYSNVVPIFVRNIYTGGSINDVAPTCYGQLPGIIVGSDNKYADANMRWESSPNGIDSWTDIKNEKYKDLQLTNQFKTSFIRRITHNDQCGDVPSNTVKLKIYDKLDSVNLTIKDKYCKGERIQFSYPLSFNDFIMWNWNGNTLKSQTFTIDSILIDQTFYVYRQDSNNCRSIIKKYDLSVDNVKADFTTDLSEVNVGTPVHFRNESKNAVRYKWILCDHCEPASISEPWFYFNREGTYPVKLYAYSSHNCVDTISKKDAILVFDPGMVDKINDLSTDDALFIYPNPVSENINMEGNKLPGAKVMLYSLDGKLAFSTELTSIKNKVNVGSLQAGIYIMRIVSKTNTILVEQTKIVKQ